MLRLWAGLGVVLAGAGAAQAEPPRVVTDIAPIHGLVSEVMAGVATPELLIQPGASPHEYSLRPSEARALSEADLVVWVGDALTPWMEDSVAALADDAISLELAGVEGTLVLPFRESAVFAPAADGHGHGHGHDEHGHEAEKAAGHDHGHGHDHETEKAAGHDHGHGHDHAEHDHAHKETAAANHGHDHDHGHDHAGGIDSHLWLDPRNAQVWVAALATQLAAQDPKNAETYRQNANAAIARLEELEQSLDARLSSLRDLRFVVFHDAYQYFEARFGLQALGAVAISDARDPSPARLAALRAAIEEAGADCALAEPQFNPGLLEAVFEGAKTRSLVIDPIGAELAPGTDFYGALLNGMAATFEACR